VLLYYQWIFCGNIIWDTLYISEFSIWVYPRNLLQALRHIKDYQRWLLPDSHQAVTCLIAYTLEDKTNKLVSNFRDKLSILILYNSETLEHLWNTIDFQSKTDLDEYDTKVTNQKSINNLWSHHC